mgnify:CR=1 FL=1
MVNILQRIFKPGLFSMSEARAYQRGIARRYTDQADRWREHLTRSQEEVRNFVTKHRPRVLYVLGSGWLLDLPIDYLIEHVPEIHFVDIAHPRTILSRYRKQRSLHFESLDLTGGLINLLGKISREHFDKKALIDAIAALRPPEFFNQRSASVISLNLLSQLPYPLLTDANAALLGDDLEVACAALQTQHLTWLRKFPHRLLIFDFEEVRNMPHYSAPELVPTIYTDFPVLHNRKDWIWLFDCNGSYIHNMTTHLRVAAGELE